jgi:hypothetical protein
MLLAVLVLVAAPASATPNMIRLGYPTCASCHVSPQGGGLLTHYGEGIDLAQTLRPEEPRNPDILDDDGLGSRLNYDLRGTLGIEREPPDPAGYGLNLSVRSAVGFRPKHRLVYQASVAAPTLTRTRAPGAISLGMSRLYWLYQAKDGLTFVVGRDALPSGLSFARRTTNPNVSSNPTQAKVFWWNKRWQVTAYGYGPDGNETQPRFEARGGGAVLGVNEQWAKSQRRQRLLEARLLSRDGAVVDLRGVKVREHALRRCALEHVADVGHVHPANPGAAHSGVDRQVPRLAARRPALDRVARLERRAERGAARGVELRRQQRCEDDDRPRDPRAPKLLALADCRDAEPPRFQLFERVRDADGAEPVRVGLDHGKERHARLRGDGGPISSQRAQIDVDPGACHATVH